MEHCCSRLALLLHLPWFESFLPKTTKISSYHSICYLYDLSNYSLIHHLLCDRIFLSHFVHFVRWSRYYFCNLGILFVHPSFKKTSVNLIFWLEMYIGISIVFTLYLTEVYARNKISNEKIFENWGFLGYFIPRTLYLSQWWLHTVISYNIYILSIY